MRHRFSLKQFSIKLTVIRESIVTVAIAVTIDAMTVDFTPERVPVHIISVHDYLVKLNRG